MFSIFNFNATEDVFGPISFQVDRSSWRENTSERYTGHKKWSNKLGSDAAALLEF